MQERTAWSMEALRPRHRLTLVAVTLVVVGCLAVLSAADGSATGSAFGYFAKATVFGAAGLALMLWIGRGGRGGRGGLVLAHRFSTALLVAGFAGVLLVMVPTPLTPSINGARQWFVIPGGFTIQPSEILKPALVLHLALTLARDPWRKRSLHDLRPVLGVATAALLVIAAQDLGSAIVTGAVVLTVLFAAGVAGRVLGGMVGLAGLGALALTLIAPERIERFTIFLAPFDDRYGAGFQITNGLMAIGSGGLFGNGIGESLQKHIIPEPQTDFILPVIMEEVGLLGASLVLGLYMMLVWLGLSIARRTGDPYERLVATGLTSIVLWQAALNIWVVLGIAPLTGVPLPLISAGGTSQVILLAVLGLLIDIDRRSALPTVPLVMPTTAPRRPRPATPLEPAGEEPRIVDRRPARAPRERPAPATAAGVAAPAPRPLGPRVIERIGELELREDGTVKLPDGRVARPKRPMRLPDGRILHPDGTISPAPRAAAGQRPDARA